MGFCIRGVEQLDVTIRDLVRHTLKQVETLSLLHSCTLAEGFENYRFNVTIRFQQLLHFLNRQHALSASIQLTLKSADKVVHVHHFFIRAWQYGWPAMKLVQRR